MTGKNLLFPFLFLALLAISLSNKMFGISVILGITMFYLYFKNLAIALFATLLFVLPFERGIRDWFIQVVPPGPDMWFRGYGFYFAFTLKLLLFPMALIFALLNKRIPPNRLVLPDKLILFFFILVLAQTIAVNDNTVAMFGLIRLAETVGVYFIARFYFSFEKTKQLLIAFVLSLLVIFGLIGTMQTILRHPIGIYMEETSGIRPAGYLTTDGVVLFRTSGLSTHPTYFGSLLSMLVSIAISILIVSLSNKNKSKCLMVMSIAGVVLGLFSLLGTYSRSAWVAMGLVIVLLIRQFYRSKNLGDYWHKNKIYILLAFTGITVLALLVFGTSVLLRLESFVDIWTTGNGAGRLNLMKYALLMTRDNPIWGVGLNNFTLAMNSYDLNLVEKTFLYPVHNTFLLLFAETGVLGGLFFCLFSISSLVLTLDKAKKDIMLFSIWLGVLAFTVNAQFHTLFTLDPSMEIAMVLIAYLLSEKRPYKALS